MPDLGKSPSTAAQRKAKERADKRARGLRPLEVWARPEHHPQIKALADSLTSEPSVERANYLHQEIRMQELQRDKYAALAHSARVGSDAHTAATMTANAMQDNINWMRSQASD